MESTLTLLFCLLQSIVNPNNENEEAKNIKETFKAEVSQTMITDSEYLIAAERLVKKEMLARPDGSESQYFIFVNRNPLRQDIMVGFYDAERKEIDMIGWDKISTGNPKRKGFYLTPTGTFEITVERIGYRAKGTKNAKGWMGIGEKGARVWSYGWQQTTGYGGMNMRIMLHLHATDPTYGEPRLGRPDSKGCVRISAKMNRFLDYYGILDKYLEGYPEKAKKILLKDRRPVKSPGKLMIVGDIE